MEKILYLTEYESKVELGVNQITSFLQNSCFTKGKYFAVIHLMKNIVLKFGILG